VEKVPDRPPILILHVKCEKIYIDDDNIQIEISKYTRNLCNRNCTN